MASSGPVCKDDGVKSVAQSEIHCGGGGLLPSASNANQRDGFQYHAERLAAYALENDMAKWLTFKASDPPDDKAFEDFLQRNSPSTTERLGSDGIGWVCVRAPHRLHSDEDEDKDDVEGLEDAWEDLQSSGKTINVDVVLDLASEYKVLCGKWHLHVGTGFKIDHAWEGIARAVVAGRCGHSAKVSPFDSNRTGRKPHVICVYNDDCTDLDSIFELEASIREVGIKCHMMYKPDAFTYLGIYSKNRWGLVPALYRSVYDCRQRKTRITKLY